MLLRIDPTATAALHVQIAAGLRAAISDGDVARGERLPSARDLAADLDVNMHTVLRAYQALRDEGLVDMRRGRGVTVRAGVDRTALVAAAHDLVAAARRLGLDLDATAELLAQHWGPTPDEGTVT